MSPWLDFALFSILAATAVGIVMLRHLFAVVMLGGVFSLVTSTLFVVMDAPDVAFTEAAVGAGVVTVLLLGAIALTTRRERPAAGGVAIPLAVSIITGLALIYGTLDLPHFGAPDAPVHLHVAPDYLVVRAPEIDIPNIVTAVLASYRGFDTLGEVIVVFAAGVGVILLIGQHHVGRRRPEEEVEEETTTAGKTSNGAPRSQ
jgi:multicomponent Na+:H+ antiporter subunit B